MRCYRIFAAATILPMLQAAEIAAPVSEVQIFRNGESVISHTADPKGKSIFTVSGNFSPLDGTLWYSSNVKQIRKLITETEKKEPVSLNDITSTYKNQRVTLRLQNNTNGKQEKISGTVLDLFPKESADRRNFVALKCADGKTLVIFRHRITGVESSSVKIAERSVKEQKQAWEFTMNPRLRGKVQFDYISNTLNWTPAFRMVLLPERKMKLTCSATVVNRGEKIDKVKCILWGGSPNIANSGTVSPMAIVKSAPPRPTPRPLMSYRQKRSFAAARMVADNAVQYAPSAPGITGNMVPFELGTISLKKNEALVRTLGEAAGSYENLVRWRIPARHIDNGRRVWKNNSDFTNAVFECLRFKNPFKHPLPDAAVEVCDGSRVLAQIKGSWVNTGESAIWEVTRCRDVKVSFVEQEAPSTIKNRGAKIFQRIDHGKLPVPKRSAAKKQAVSYIKGGSINGQWYRVTDVKGYMELKNFRKTPVKTVIEMEYFGEFVSASGKPSKMAVNHFGSLNPKNKLIWEITLKPGENRKLDFRYNIIVNR